MKKFLRSLALIAGLGVAPLCLLPVQTQAQQDPRQEAYQAGYQNGVNDAQRNRPMNINTDNWHGDRLPSYQQGYEAGYRSASSRHENGLYEHDEAQQRAYQAGYQNGTNDGQRDRPMNLNNGNWHGDRLTAYQKGYEEGYRSAEGNREHHHHDDDDR